MKIQGFSKLTTTGVHWYNTGKGSKNKIYTMVNKSKLEIK